MHRYNLYHNQDLQQFHHPGKSPLCPFPVNPHFPPHNPKQSLICQHNGLDLSKFLVSNEIKLYRIYYSFVSGLLSLSVFLTFNHVAGWISSWLDFNTEWYSIVWICCNLIYPSTCRWILALFPGIGFYE